MSATRRRASASGSRRRTRTPRALVLGVVRLRARLGRSVHQSTEYARGITMMLFGLIAALGHPLYYLVWTYFYPQPYESLWLRLFSAAVCVPLVFEARLSRRRPFRRALASYWLILLVFELPFFFFFMSLMNGFSIIWSVSTMAACMLLVALMFDWLLVLLVAAGGATAAWLCFVALGSPAALDNDRILAVSLVYLFALVAGSAFNHKAELVARERLAGMTAAVGTMAHELRTPFLGIRSGADGLRRYLPALLGAYAQAREHGLEVEPIRMSHLRQMESVLANIALETEYSRVILDMLVTNSSRARIESASFDVYSAGACIDSALARYPFQSEAQRGRVAWARLSDFDFFGSQVLMVHVLFNLLKNALYFIDRVDDGRIEISVEPAQAGMNQVRFKDTGPGVAPEALPMLFDSFYSRMPEGEGTGIGLAFCRRVMLSFGGDIFCLSEPGRYCEFVMLFPPVDAHDDR